MPEDSRSFNNPVPKKHEYGGLGISAVALLLTALWFYFQLLQWRAHGDNYMPFVANIVMTLTLWGLLIAAIVRFYIAHKPIQGVDHGNVELPNNQLQTKQKKIEDVSHYAAALNREVASLNERLKDCNEKRQMPRPYLEVLNSVESMFSKTPFVLTNRGGDVAHNVQIQPLTIKHRTVIFDPIPTLAVNDQKQTLPTIVGIGAMQEHDILSLMVDEWNSAFSGAGLAALDVHEWPAKITITYEDFASNKFEVALDLVVFPIDKTLADKHGNDWPKHEYKTVEVRNIKFTAV